jgi:hypothetical protein
MTHAPRMNIAPKLAENRLVGARPGEHDFGSYFSGLEKNPTAHGGQGGLPLGPHPPLGERGGHPRNFDAGSKNPEGISPEPIFSDYQSFRKLSCRLVKNGKASKF